MPRDRKSLISAFAARIRVERATNNRPSACKPGRRPLRDAQGPPRPPIPLVSPFEELDAPPDDFGQRSPGRPTVVVRADGSIAIPRGVRDALLLDPGERVSVGFEQGVVTVRPVEAWEPASPSSAASRVVSPLDREIEAFLRRRKTRR